MVVLLPTGSSKNRLGKVKVAFVYTTNHKNNSNISEADSFLKNPCKTAVLRWRGKEPIELCRLDGGNAVNGVIKFSLSAVKIFIDLLQSHYKLIRGVTI